MPKQMYFYFFVALFAIFLYFLQWNLSEFSQHIAIRRLQILNMKKVGFVRVVFFNFTKFMSFVAAKKLVL